jgi:hypothetical protein
MAGSHENPILPTADAAPENIGVKTIADSKYPQFKDPDAKDSDFNDVSSPASVAAVPVALPDGTTDPVYEAKARVLNQAVRTGIDF